jgi:hypothetical protein
VRGERIVFAVAAIAVIGHLLDHLIVGVESSVQFDGVVALGVVTAAGALVYPRLPREVQAVGSIVLGVMWLLGDLFHHVVPMVRDGAEAADYTGLAATLAGVLLIGVGIAAGLRRPAAGADRLAQAHGRGA